MINKFLKNPLNKFSLWFLGILLVCFIGVSNVFADTTIDTSTWLQVSGRNWSISGLEYSSTKSYTSDLFKNAYNITGGLYIPPDSTDYITFSYFEHNSNVFNPCNDANFTATFKIYLSNPNFVNYVNQIKWGSDNCVISKNSSTGYIDATCIASRSTSNYTDIFVYWDEITGTDYSDVYISRYINVNCSLDVNSLIINDNANTQNIINNNNSNTQDIINNQDQNTQDIVNNQNSIAQQQQEQQMVCTENEYNNTDNIYTNNYYIDNTNAVHSNNDFALTDYILIGSGINQIIGATRGSPAYCLYNLDKTLISCESYNNRNNITISVNNKVYIRYTIEKNNTNFKVKLNQCKNGNQALQDTLTNDNVDENNIANAFESFNNFLDDNSTITQLITLPIILYTAILNNLNGTCQPFNLGKLYGSDLILPCINISQYLGNALWSMIDIIISGFAIYAISKKMIKIFNNFSSLREGDVIDD